MLEFFFTLLMVGAILYGIYLLAEVMAFTAGPLFERFARWLLKVGWGLDKPLSGADALIGQRARANEDFSRVSDCGPLEGYVLVRGERWLARVEDGAHELSAGKTLEVSGREGLVLMVCRVEG